MNEEQRRLTFLRENVESLAEEKSTLESFLWHLKSSTENESLEILRRFRGGADPQSLVQQIQASRSLAQVKDDNTAYSQSQSIHNTFPCQYFGTTIPRLNTIFTLRFYFRHTANVPANSERIIRTHHPGYSNKPSL
jgi:hypothetical protein